MPRRGHAGAFYENRFVRSGQQSKLMTFYFVGDTLALHGPASTLR